MAAADRRGLCPATAPGHAVRVQPADRPDAGAQPGGYGSQLRALSEADRDPDLPAGARQHLQDRGHRHRDLHGAGISAGILDAPAEPGAARSEEHTSELQSLMRISYAVFCFKTKKQQKPRVQQLYRYSSDSNTYITNQ